MYFYQFLMLIFFLLLTHQESQDFWGGMHLKLETSNALQITVNLIYLKALNNNNNNNNEKCFTSHNETP